MKKTILFLALIVVLGYAGISTAESPLNDGLRSVTGPEECSGTGWSDDTPSAYDAMGTYRNDTTDLEEKMFGNQKDYLGEMNQQDQENDLARELRSEVFFLQNECTKKL